MENEYYDLEIHEIMKGYSGNRFRVCAPLDPHILKRSAHQYDQERIVKLLDYFFGDTPLVHFFHIMGTNANPTKVFPRVESRISGAVSGRFGSKRRQGDMVWSYSNIDAAS